MERVILHIDMDYFFAQIEERENPRFLGKPIVVGADPKGGKGRGVVSTANYVARKYGIKSGLPISQAYKLCPKAIFLPPNKPLYEKVSQRIMAIIKKYSPIFEQTSLDEAYLDLSPIFKDLRKLGIKEKWREVEKLAKKLKREIFEKESLTCSVGIGPNKLIAKMASERAKPNGLLIIKPSEVRKFLEPLEVEKIPGIGPKTREKLKNLKVEKISDLRKLSKERLKRIFGKRGEWFFEAARGIDERPVAQKEIVKSIGKQITLERDTTKAEIIFGAFEKIVKEIFKELVENNFSFKTITVICRYRDFETHSKSKTLKNPSQDFKVLNKEAKKLLLKFLVEKPKPIRLIGLRVKR